ncbi:hypothetical protein MNBD_GAMMA03-2021 [hydrothermal vent metagenome]|uniref:TfoX N-terminal domain-containing protein n=1 Tax=hydrothermal vent metagenome TaxID=652676 RepID=A0A3B0WDS4_9ZZZZ
MSDETMAFFWELAEPLLAEESIVKGTMMGFPCLRVNGEFFASVERKTGNLIVKLPATRVLDLIETEVGNPFAPAGRRFKEWASIPNRDAALWQQLINDARAFVEGNL